MDRRSFLVKLVVGAAGLLWPGRLLAEETSSPLHTCRSCGAGVLPAARHRLRHCPGCGRDAAGRFDLPRARTPRFRQRPMQAPTWDWAQVPFPHPELVASADRTPFSLSQIRFSGRETARA